MHDDEEILDLVNDDDVVIGQITREAALTADLSNVRIVHLFIQNSAGALLIPRRPAHKRIAPNGLDFSVSGYVMAGEDYDTAMQREFLEEAQQPLDLSKVRRVGVMKPSEFAIHGFSAVYVLLNDEKPNYNPDDFVSSEWVMPHDLVQRLAAGENAKSDLIHVVRYCFGLQHDC